MKRVAMCRVWQWSLLGFGIAGAGCATLPPPAANGERQEAVSSQQQVQQQEDAAPGVESVILLKKHRTDSLNEPVPVVEVMDARGVQRVVSDAAVVGEDGWVGARDLVRDQPDLVLNFPYADYVLPDAEIRRAYQWLDSIQTAQPLTIGVQGTAYESLLRRQMVAGAREYFVGQALQEKNTPYVNLPYNPRLAGGQARLYALSAARSVHSGFETAPIPNERRYGQAQHVVVFQEATLQLGKGELRRLEAWVAKQPRGRRYTIAGSNGYRSDEAAAFARKRAEVIASMLSKIGARVTIYDYDWLLPSKRAFIWWQTR